MKPLYASILAFLFPLLLWGQYQWDAGIFAGSAFYLGDLNDQTLPNFDESQLAYGLSLNYHFNYNWGLRTQLMRGTIAGSDEHFDNEIIRTMRNVRFESTLTELSVQLLWEPFAHRRYATPLNFNKLFSPYLFIGLGGLIVDAKPNFEGSAREEFYERIQEDESKMYPNGFATVPIGGGVNIDFSSRTTLGLELGMRTAFTDYLDGVSATGNKDKNDWYAFGGLTLIYRFVSMDTDGDGVVDVEDACPNEPGLPTSKGCPDRDRDGVADMEDVCPDEVGPIGLNGCPDRDGDIVIDLFDACPDEPGLPELEGCPDTDGDGITDGKDACPELEGPEEWEGCPDSDGDGIANHLDECPDEAGPLNLQGCQPKDADEDGVLDEVDECPEVAGLAAFNGCPDTDEDGIEDRLDKCPEQKGKGVTFGCPALTEEAKKLLALATESVKFETGSSKLTAESLEILGQLAALVNEWPAYKLEIEGHTDSQGKDENNLKLSKDRAKACYDFFIEKTIEENRLSYDGKGETEPIGDNGTKKGRQKNRRVEFELVLNF